MKISVFGGDNKADDILYHASPVIVEKPKWDYIPEEGEIINLNKDFGAGFYTSLNDREYPIYLRCADNKIILNKYRLVGIIENKLELKNDLKWLLVTAFHRSNFSKRKKYHKLRDEIREVIAGFDLIIGTISDDDFYSTIDDFIANGITDTVAIQVVQLIKFGIQYVFKSETACSKLEFLGYEEIHFEEILKYRQIKQLNRADMEESIDDLKVKLHPNDRGRLFANIIESGEANASTWF